MKISRWNFLFQSFHIKKHLSFKLKFSNRYFWLRIPKEQINSHQSCHLKNKCLTNELRLVFRYHIRRKKSIIFFSLDDFTWWSCNVPYVDNILVSETAPGPFWLPLLSQKFLFLIFFKKKFHLDWTLFWTKGWWYLLWNNKGSSSLEIIVPLRTRYNSIQTEYNFLI